MSVAWPSFRSFCSWVFNIYMCERPFWFVTRRGLDLNCPCQSWGSTFNQHVLKYTSMLYLGVIITISIFALGLNLTMCECTHGRAWCYHSVWTNKVQHTAHMYLVVCLLLRLLLMFAACFEDLLWIRDFTAPLCSRTLENISWLARTHFQDRSILPRIYSACTCGDFNCYFKMFKMCWLSP